MMLPGGGPFSMALELLGYYHADARTLTYTAYTYGRGFADAHRAGQSDEVTQTDMFLQILFYPDQFLRFIYTDLAEVPGQLVMLQDLSQHLNLQLRIE